MSFKYNYNDLRNVVFTSGGSSTDWSNNITLIAESFVDFINNESFTGSWADNIKAYLQQVHVTSIAAITQMLTDFNAKMFLYAFGLYGYETFDTAVIPEEKLIEAEALQDAVLEFYEEVHGEIKTLVDEIADIAGVSMPSLEPIRETLSGMKTEITTYKTSLSDYDHEWAASLSDLEEFIANTKAVIEEVYNGKGKTIIGYEDGSFFNLEKVQLLDASYSTSCDYIAENEERINLAVSHQAGVVDKLNYQAIIDRQDYGMQLVIKGGVIVLSALATICTGGAGTPLLLATLKWGFTACSALYGISDLVQGKQELKLAFEGDVTTAAINPIRDTVFMGCQEAYDKWGKLSLLGMSGTSIVAKGFTGAVGADKLVNMGSWKSFNVGTFGKELVEEVTEEVIEEGVGSLTSATLSTMGADPLTCMAGEFAGGLLSGRPNDCDVSVNKYADMADPSINRLDFDTNYGKINASQNLDYADINSNRLKCVGDNGGGFDGDTTNHDDIRNIANTNGLRNDLPLSQEQIDELVSYAKSLGFPEDKIHIAGEVNTTNTSMLYDEFLIINNDVLPTNKPTNNPNSLVSGRGAIAHEIIGHYETALKGTAFNQYDMVDNQMVKNSYNTALDEAQASIRAARFAPDLTHEERVILIRDGLQRLKQEGIKINEVRHLLDIEER